MTSMAMLSVTPQVSALPTFDLSFVLERLRKEHRFWSKAKCEKAINEYRHYLAECKAQPKGLTPSRLADEAWHAHILFTREYARDCEAYFGFFLHHVPVVSAQEQASCSCSPEGGCVGLDDVKKQWDDSLGQENPIMSFSKAPCSCTNKGNGTLCGGDTGGCSSAPKAH